MIISIPESFDYCSLVFSSSIHGTIDKCGKSEKREQKVWSATILIIFLPPRYLLLRACCYNNLFLVYQLLPSSYSPRSPVILSSSSTSYTLLFAMIFPTPISTRHNNKIASGMIISESNLDNLRGIKDMRYTVVL